MKFKDEVKVITPTPKEMEAEFSKLKLQGTWEFQRLSHMVSAFEIKTGEIHLFMTEDPKEMAQELKLRDLEIFNKGDEWS